MARYEDYFGGGRTTAKRRDPFADIAARRSLGATNPEIRTPGDPQWVKRLIDQQSFVPSAYSENQIIKAKRQAERALDSLGDALTPATRKKLEEIQLTGRVRPSSGWRNLLNVLDTPAEMIRMAIADITGTDERLGGEIELGDYWDAAIGNEHLLQDRLGPKLMPEDAPQFIAPYDAQLEEAIPNKGVRIGTSFLADVALDPLSYVSFATLGIGRAAAMKAAKATSATAAKIAGRAVIEGATKESLTNPLARRMFEAIQLRSQKVHTALKNSEYGRVLQEAGEDLGDVALSMEARRALALAGEGSEALGETVAFYGRHGLTSGAQETADRITQLVAQGKAKTLAREFPEYVAKETAASPFSTGGVKVASPLFRRTIHERLGVPVLDLGLRTDLGVAEKVGDLFRKIPGVSGVAARSALRRTGTEIPELSLARRGKAFSYSLARQASEDAVAPLSSGGPATKAVAAIRQLATAEHEHKLPQLSLLKLQQTLIGIPDEFFHAVASKRLKALGVADDAILALEKLLVSSGEQIRSVTDTVHQLALDSGMEIGNIRNYSPMMATKAYRNIVTELADSGVGIGPELWDSVADPEARYGLQLLSQHVSAEGVARSAVERNPGRPRFSLERVTGRGVMAAIDKFVLIDFDSADAAATIASAVQSGYTPTEAIGNALHKAIQILANSGKLSRALPADQPAFNDNLAEVLSQYVATMSQAIKYRFFAKALEPMGLAQRITKRIDVGDTIANVADQQVLFDQVREALEAGKTLTSVMQSIVRHDAVTVTVAPGFTIEVPTMLAQRKQFQVRLEKLRRQFDRVKATENETREITNRAAEEWIRQGLPEELAHTIAASLADGEVRSFSDELVAAAEEKASELISVVAEAAASNPELSLEAARATLLMAARQADQLRDDAWRVRRKMESSWRSRFNTKTTITQEETIDLLGARADGTMHLAGIIEKVRASGQIIGIPKVDASAGLASAGKNAQNMMVEAFSSKPITVKGLRSLMGEERQLEVARFLGVDPDSTVRVSGLLAELPPFSLDQIQTTPALTILWVHSFGKAADERVMQRAMKTYALLEQAATTLLKPSKQARAEQAVLDLIAQGDSARLLLPKNREALLGVMARAGIQEEFLDFGEHTIIWRSVTPKTIPQRVPIEQVVAELRRLFKKGDELPVDELVRKASRLPKKKKLELSEELQRLLATLGPSGELPFDVAEYEYVRGLQRIVQESRLGIKHHLEVTGKMLDDAKELVPALDAITKSIARAVYGRGQKNLASVWQANRSVLFKVLNEDQFARIHRLVDYLTAPVGKGKHLVDRSIRAEINNLHQIRAGLANWTEKGINSVTAVQTAKFDRRVQAIEAWRDAWLRSMQLYSHEPDTFGPLFEEGFAEAYKAYRGYTRKARTAVRDIAGLAERAGAPDDVYKPWQRLAKQMQTPPATKRLTAEAEGFVPPAVAGLAGDVLEDMKLDRDVALIMENMVQEIRSVMTPVGLKLLKGQAEEVLRWWATATTVGRPTFVPRNLLGGIINGMIIKVDPQNYAMAARAIPKYRHAVEVLNLDHEAALLTLREGDRPFVDGLILSNLLMTSHATNISVAALGDPWKLREALNPINARKFAPFRIGGMAMQRSEDFLRSAAFFRHYDPTRPETMEFARQMALVAHFDYAHLSTMEGWARLVAPFFVWTRRNIPLQIRNMVENPRMIRKYQAFVRGISGIVDEGESTADQFEGSEFFSDNAVETDIMLNDDTPFWARVVFDPEVPIRDLEMFVRAISNGELSQFITRSFHPGIALPITLPSTESYGDVVAPSGLREFANIFLRAYDKDTPGDEAGDVMVPYGLARTFGSLVPFLSEWQNLSGTRPSDVRQQARLGYSELDETENSAAERVRAAALTLARAFGVRLQTPADELGPAAEARSEVGDITELVRPFTEEARKKREELAAS